MPLPTRSAVLAAAAALFLAPAAFPAAAPESDSARLLGSYVVPHDLRVDGTPVGGLSSIDYDRRSGEFAFVSDDWSDYAPARYYRATVTVTERGIEDVTFTGAREFRRPDGSTYPTIDTWRTEQHQVPTTERNVLGTVDPEELRVDPLSGDVAWTNEGQRNVPENGSVRDTVLLDPALRISHHDGRYLRDLPTAPNERMTMGEEGPRVNETFEGLTYTAGGTQLVSALEGPLEQDGPSANADHGAVSRITVHDRAGLPIAQYAYPVEPLFAHPQPPNDWNTNGISSLLADDEPNRFLALERGYASGVGTKGRIFEFSTTGADDVMDRHSLADGGFRPVRKQLLVDLDEIGVDYTDNVEGISWGPRLPTGERVLLVVSDNNFSPGQQTQLIAIAVR
ncbi:esterase-like activity of phytase family protein [Saccharopolyspora sp. K220]|uniref:esterase-like activity of phytase family protein n=1 Tax=Saccharopolyspora soli TaxID=2926618 RepID=UPI001F55B5D8|nr:esterase-like activity of phytase family protein [Saccharopolyspora soli]MCI2422420.1 esterase-like activity of phytase family protein [Saccharopolyspora soli]